MVEESETSSGTWPYAAQYFSGQGFRQHYIDEVELVEAMLREIWPDAPSISLPNVGHYAQEDAPDSVVAMIEQFVRSN